MKLRKVSFAVAAAAAIGLTGLIAPAASAGSGNCSLGNACVWRSANYEPAGHAHGTNKNFSVLPAVIDNLSNSAAANGKTCKYTNFYDAKSPSGSYFQLWSRERTDQNYRDPLLSNGAGVGSNSGQNWKNRVSSIKFLNCQ